MRAKGAAKRTLKREGRAKVALKVTYTPDGGAPKTKGTKVTLVKK